MLECVHFRALMCDFVRRFMHWMYISVVSLKDTIYTNLAGKFNE